MTKLNDNELRLAREELKAGARERVADRGLLQFQAPPEMVRSVLTAADDKKMTVGALLRTWVEERLAADAQNP